MLRFEEMNAKVHKITYLKHLEYIWISLMFFLIAPTIYVVSIFNGVRGSLSTILIIWIVLSLFYIVGFVLHYSFYMLDKNKTLMIEDDCKFILKDNGTTHSFQPEDIELVTIHHSGIYNQTPWNDYDFYVIRLRNGQEHTFTCLLINLEMKILHLPANVAVIKKNHFIASLEKRKKYNNTACSDS